eukprot:3159778-Amphidinium_carterae.1
MVLELWWRWRCYNDWSHVRVLREAYWLFLSRGHRWRSWGRFPSEPLGGVVSGGGGAQRPTASSTHSPSPKAL